LTRVANIEKQPCNPTVPPPHHTRSSSIGSGGRHAPKRVGFITEMRSLDWGVWIQELENSLNTIFADRMSLWQVKLTNEPVREDQTVIRAQPFDLAPNQRRHRPAGSTMRLRTLFLKQMGIAWYAARGCRSQAAPPVAHRTDAKRQAARCNPPSRAGLQASSLADPSHATLAHDDLVQIHRDGTIVLAESAAAHISPS
jgi:hypothetical protein